MRADVRPPQVPLTLVLLSLFPRGGWNPDLLPLGILNPASHPTSREPTFFSQSPLSPKFLMGSLCPVQAVSCCWHCISLVLPASPPRFLNLLAETSAIFLMVSCRKPSPSPAHSSPSPPSARASCRMKAPKQLFISPPCSCPQTTQQQAQRWDGGGPGAQIEAVWRRRQPARCQEG